LYGAETLGKQIRNTLRKFWNLVLEKDGEDQLDTSCKKCGILLGVQEQGNILHAIKRREANWIGHIL
jgi:hypothetical protein